MGNSMSGRLQVKELLSPDGATAMTIGDTGTVSLASGSGTEIDMWQITANKVPSGSHILTDNWIRCGTGVNVDYNSFTKVGTGMSVSSGWWTFPSTGTWRIQGTFTFHAPAGSGDEAKACDAQIRYSIDGGSTTVGGAIGYAGCNLNEAHYTDSATLETYFNVTDKDNFKVHFVVQNGGSADNYLYGSGAWPYTRVIFTKIPTF